MNDSSYNNTIKGCHFSGCGTHIYVTALVLLAVISTLVNLVVITVVHKNKTLKQRPTLILLSILSAIHFLSACILTPIKASIVIKPDNRLFVVFQVLFIAAIIFSFTTIVVITFDRLLHVYYLTKYRVTNKTICFVLIALSVLLFLLTYFAGGIVALVYFILGISAMIGAYIGMILTLRIHHMNIAVTDELYTDTMMNQGRAVRTTLIIATTFLFMNIPSMIAVVHDMDKHFTAGLCALMFVAYLLNATMNPCIYYYCIPVLKKNFKDLGGCRQRDEDLDHKYTSTLEEDGQGNMLAVVAPVATISQKE